MNTLLIVAFLLLLAALGYVAFLLLLAALVYMAVFTDIDR